MDYRVSPSPVCLVHRRAPILQQWTSNRTRAHYSRLAQGSEGKSAGPAIALRNNRILVKPPRRMNVGKVRRRY